MRRIVLITLLILGTAAAVARAEAEPSPSPDLTGAWVLDKDASDNPTAMMPSRNDGKGGRRSGPPPGGGRGGPGGGGGGRAMAGGDDGSRRGRPMEDPGKARERLTIYLDGDEFNVTDGNDLSTVFAVGGRASQVWTPRGACTANALWEGTVLRIELSAPEGGRGGAERLTYALEDDRLVVTRTVTPPGADEAVTLRSVYTRTAAD
ncbi:MAG TPA: hypothetical protein P5571_15580 [Candidatus Krumholzibacteria bacterium]|nr:hypothetical protein [Candidatus Krumholzibacteria bacterium]